MIFGIACHYFFPISQVFQINSCRALPLRFQPHQAMFQVLDPPPARRAWKIRQVYAASPGVRERGWRSKRATVPD
jgi:hypothetical protein